MKTMNNLTRRSFLKVVGGVTAGFALGCFPSTATSAGTETAAKAATDPFTPNAFISILPNGQITVTITRTDMGQGVRTSFAMLVAEELDADWSKIGVRQAGASSVGENGQGTGGSSSTTSMHNDLRKMGAGARSMLVAAAAKTWGVDAATCHTDTGRVIHSSGKSLTYGELAETAKGMPVPSGDIKLKARADFKIIGKRTSRIDNKAVVDGSAIYGMDVKVPGLLRAVISRRPNYGATLLTVDDAAAHKVPGVVDVVKISSGVAVVATNTWSAMQGRDALKVTWSPGPNAMLDTPKLRASLKAAVGEHKPTPAGAKVVEAAYDLPYLAHATLEPMNATAWVKDGECTIWAPTQSPDSARGEAARLLNMPEDKVTVHLTLVGGGFGRRSMNDFVHEAVEISNQLKKPVQVVWSRDDDLRNDHYRPMSHHAFRGAVDSVGKPVAWSHQALNAPGRGKAGKFGEANIPYNIPNSGMTEGGVSSPIPFGYWRSVEHSQIHVVNECFIDEMAHAAGKDPFKFRHDLIDDDRLKKVLEVAAEKSGWGAPLPPGHGRGIACFEGYGSYAAHVIELSVIAGKIKLLRAVCVIDCGLAINPSGVEAQMQGACSDGLATALHAEITVDKGQVVQTSYFDYEWIRIDEMPKQEVYIIESNAEPGGMGETGYPSVMPAVANAVFSATGKRVRKFPIRMNELV